MIFRAKSFSGFFLNGGLIETFNDLYIFFTRLLDHLVDLFLVFGLPLCLLSMVFQLRLLMGRLDLS